MLDEGKIVTAVADALQFVGTGGDRLVRLMEFIAQLENDPSWTTAEVATVQSRVSRIISNEP